VFYEQAQSLIGVCKDQGVGSSKTLTLSLDKYDDQALMGDSMSAEDGVNAVEDEDESAGAKRKSIGGEIGGLGKRGRVAAGDIQ